MEERAVERELVAGRPPRAAASAGDSGWDSPGCGTYTVHPGLALAPERVMCWRLGFPNPASPGCATSSGPCWAGGSHTFRGPPGRPLLPLPLQRLGSREGGRTSFRAFSRVPKRLAHVGSFVPSVTGWPVLGTLSTPVSLRVLTCRMGGTRPSLRAAGGLLSEVSGSRWEQRPALCEHMSEPALLPLFIDWLVTVVNRYCVLLNEALRCCLFVPGAPVEPPRSLAFTPPALSSPFSPL